MSTTRVVTAAAERAGPVSESGCHWIVYWIVYWIVGGAS
jgi:hypothetical protein